MNMTPQRWDNTNTYLREVFGKQDSVLGGLMPAAIAAGIPAIAVSADVGRLLHLLVQLACARPGATGRVIELGTLAGYSGIWIARALPPGGKLITIEPEPKHADFAQRMFAAAGVADRVEIRRTTGIAALHDLARELGPQSVDAVFLDAIKTEYPEYFRLAHPLIGRGGLLLADNVLGSGNWWIDEAAPGEARESRDAADRFNRMVADDPDFEAAAVPIREGVLIARRR
ncbi:MAG: O-methyltransferase [Phycisphaeraceae bacterium]|nr:O-methyltransferase [Phycisphaeraceae bacterium]